MEQAVAVMDTPIRKKTGRPSNGTSAIIRAKIRETYQKNPQLTHSEVAEIVGVERKTVEAHLGKLAEEKAELDEFKRDRADIFANVQKRVLASLTDEEIKKANVRDKTILLGTVYDKERLERGESTSNLAGIVKVLKVADSPV